MTTKKPTQPARLAEPYTFSPEALAYVPTIQELGKEHLRIMHTPDGQGEED